MDSLQNNANPSGAQIHSQIETKTDGALKRLPEYETATNEQTAEPIRKNEHQHKINKRALSKYADTYELENFENKLLIIFNHVYVTGYDEPRRGTEKDVMALKNTFENIGFTVTVKTDLSKAEILSELDKFADIDFSDYGCVAVAVLTHGSVGGELMARDISYNEEHIIQRLKVRRNPSLVTKPKILLIQACRGHEDLEGVTVHEMPSKFVFLSDKKTEDFYTLPVEADMLVIHSSYIGKASHRTIKGSWFIQTFCNKIDSLASTEDLESILIHMKRAVAIDHGVDKFNRKKDKDETEKQMPVITSTLIRKLYLRKYQ